MPHLFRIRMKIWSASDNCYDDEVAHIVVGVEIKEDAFAILLPEERRSDNI